MFSQRSALPILLAALALPFPCHSAEPRNLDSAKQEITRYIDSGEYAQTAADIAKQAGLYLNRRLDGSPQAGQKLAIVFDLDETLLSNLTHMRQLGFGYVPPLWSEWVAAGSAPVIAPTAQLYHSAEIRGVTIFLISDRREKDRSGTEKNLQLYGLTNYAALYLKPNDSRDTAAAFKTATRKEIFAKGYIIIANIGDQESDLAGGYAEKTFKLPNPFYLTE